jgi:hypothetical protein
MAAEKEPVAQNFEPTVENLGLRKRAVRAMAILSLAATLIASAGASIEANRNPNPQPQPQLDSIEMPDHSTLSVSGNIGSYDTIPGGTEFKLPGATAIVTTEKPPETRTVVEPRGFESHVQLMEWARLFDTDPQAVEPTGQKAIDLTVEKIVSIAHSEGVEQIEKISIQGYASDESDARRGSNPGFGIDDEKNVKLAEKRAHAVEGLVLAQLETQLDASTYQTVVDKIVMEPGEEVQKPEEAAAIKAMAEKLHMDEAEMVMEYNRHPENLPQEARDVLKELKSDRSVSIIISEKPEIRTVPATTEKSDIPIVIIPIIIPIIREQPSEVEVPEYKPRPKWEPVPEIGKPMDRQSPIYRSQKQPRPFNNSQGGTRHMGQRGNRMTRSHGGNAH